jgi:hypothetical protein
VNKSKSEAIYAWPATVDNGFELLMGGEKRKKEKSKPGCVGDN